jgi:chromosome segregation ATPase
MTRRFRYVLEPVRLQRDWSLMDLRQRLAACNAAVAAQERKTGELQGQAESVRQAWREIAGPARALRPDTLQGYSSYLAQLERGLAEAAEALAARERERAHAALAVAQAMRELDALERHKADRHADFIAAGDKAQMRDADDHWSILRTRRAYVGQA